MIIDTSALIAIVRMEPGYEILLEAALSETGLIPSPVLVEFGRVTSLAGNHPSADADMILATLLGERSHIEPFGEEDARLAAAANAQWGSGNGRGGPLNLLDLMVYAVARRTDRPILCTRRDFAVTDAAIHCASRVG